MTDNRSWTAWGLCTPEEAEVRRAAEVAGGDVCGCGHFRREHFEDSCRYVSRRVSGTFRYRVPCDCDGFVDSAGLGGTETDEPGFGVAIGGGAA